MTIHLLRTISMVSCNSVILKSQAINKYKTTPDGMPTANFKISFPMGIVIRYILAIITSEASSDGSMSFICLIKPTCITLPV